MVGFTPVEEQTSIISQEVQVVFHHPFIRNLFGVVAAADEGNVNCADYAKKHSPTVAVDPYTRAFMERST